MRTALSVIRSLLLRPPPAPHPSKARYTWPIKTTAWGGAMLEHEGDESVSVICIFRHLWQASHLYSEHVHSNGRYADRKPCGRHYEEPCIVLSSSWTLNPFIHCKPLCLDGCLMSGRLSDTHHPGFLSSYETSTIILRALFVPCGHHRTRPKWMSYLNLSLNINQVNKPTLHISAKKGMDSRNCLLKYTRGKTRCKCVFVYKHV